MIQFDYRYVDIDQMAAQFRGEFRDAPYAGYAHWEENGAVLIRLEPGDLTQYVIGLQSIRWPDLVGLSFFSPYQRAGIVPVDGQGDYLLSKLRFSTQERAYDGLAVICETVLGALL